MAGAGAAVSLGRPLRGSDPLELGDYRLLRRLGEGGMGSVYLARQGDGGRLVALKVIRADLAGEPDFRRRFRSEVLRAKEVPAFCTAEVLDADPDHDPPYLVVEFVNGPSLAKVVADQGPMSPANLHGLAIGVATALTAIHGAGVIHRDLKPANVLLALGSPKVIDFGIARAAEGTALTDTGIHQLIGTIAYMAPERLDPAGRPLTSAADVFAWGAVVAFAGQGRAPFGSGNVETAARILTQEPDLTGLGGDLADLVSHALAKDPNDRPSARELLDHMVNGRPLPSRQSLIVAGTRRAVVRVTSSAETTELIRPQLGRLNRFLAALMTLTVVGLTATVLGLLTGVIRLPGEASVPQENWPIGVLSPSGSPPPPPLWMQSTLRKPDLAFPHSGGSCVIADGLTVTHGHPSYLRCSSRVDPIADFSVDLEVTLQTAESCAGVWFRLADESYVLSLCDDRHVISLYRPKRGLGQLRMIALGSQVKPGEVFRARLVMQGNMISTFHNDQQVVVDLINDDHLFGEIALGVSEAIRPAEGGKPYAVVFHSIKVLDLTVRN